MSITAIAKEIRDILRWRIRNITVDPFYVMYWDFLPKMRSVFLPSNCRTCEITSNSETKIPLLLVTYKRPSYFRQTVQSFYTFNKSHLDRFLVTLLVQGEQDERTEEVIDEYSDLFYRIIRPGQNLGIAEGYNVLVKDALKMGCPYIVYLQDDFLSCESLSNYIPELIAILDQYEDIGLIRLRSTHDKVCKYNIISRRKIRNNTLLGRVAVGNGHFTLNPTLARTSVLEAVIPVTCEKDAMRKYQKLGLRTGQLMADCFRHIGESRVKDWVK